MMEWRLNVQWFINGLIHPPLKYWRVSSGLLLSRRALELSARRGWATARYINRAWIQGVEDVGGGVVSTQMRVLFQLLAVR